MQEKEFYAELGIGRIRALTGETILTYHETLTAINYISKEEMCIILGGDVLNANDEYIYGFWDYETNSTLTRGQNVCLSCQKALSYITSLKDKEKNNYVLVLDPGE